MAVYLGKLTLVIGAGLVGSALSKEGRLSDVGSFFSGAIKFASKHLKNNEKDGSGSSGKPQSDALLDQVNTLRQELERLAYGRSVSVVTSGGSGSGFFGVTTVVVIGVAGYGFIRWKGWKISDMMFVSRRGFSSACDSVGKQLDQISSSLNADKRQLSSRIDIVDSNLDENTVITLANKDEASKLSEDLSVFHEGVESVRMTVQNLETKLVEYDEKQEFANKGIYYLCNFVPKLKPKRKPELIEDSGPSSTRAIGPPQRTVVSRMSSMPPLLLEPPSPSASSSDPPKVLHTPKSISLSGLKDLQFSNTSRERTLKPSSSMASNPTPRIEEPSSSSSDSSTTSSASGFGWRLPGFGILNRTRSAAD